MTAFVDRWCTALATALPLTAAGQHRSRAANEAPLNLILHAIGGVERVTLLHGSGDGLWQLLTALSDVLENAGGCYEQPVPSMSSATIPLRLSSILRALRGVENLPLSSSPDPAGEEQGIIRAQVSRQLVLTLVQQVQASLDATPAAPSVDSSVRLQRNEATAIVTQMRQTLLEADQSVAGTEREELVALSNVLRDFIALLDTSYSDANENMQE